MIKGFKTELSKNISVTFHDKEKAEKFFTDSGDCLYSFIDLEDVTNFLSEELITDNKDQYSLEKHAFIRYVEGVGEFVCSSNKNLFTYTNKDDEESMDMCGEIIVEVPREFDVDTDEV